MSETDPLARLLLASDKAQQRLKSRYEGVTERLNKQSVIREQQDENQFFDSLYTDSDVTRTAVGSVGTGIGNTVAGVGQKIQDPASAGFNTEERPDDLLGRLLGAKDDLQNALRAPATALEILLGTNRPDSISSQVGAGIENVGERVASQGQATLDRRDLATQENIADSRITGDLFDLSTYSPGERPNIEGYGYQALEILGNFAPQAAALLIKNPTISGTTAAVAGGAQGGQAQGQDAEDYVMGLSEAELTETSELYGELRRTLPHDTAQAEVAEVARRVAFNTGGTIAALGGAATNFILKPITSKISSSVIKQGAKTIGISGAEEAVQEGSESIVSRVAVNKATGLDRQVDKDTLGDVVMGGAFGGAIGAPSGVGSAIKAKVEKRRKEIVNRVVTDRAQDLATAEKFEQGEFQEIISGVKQESIDPVAAASIFKDITESENYSDNEKNEALAAIAEVEQVATDKLDLINKIQETGEHPNLAGAKDVVVKAQEKKDLLANKADSNPELVERVDQILAEAEANVEQYETELAEYSKKEVAESIENQVQTISEVRRRSIIDTAEAPKTYEEVVTRSVVDPDFTNSEEFTQLTSNPENFSKEQQEVIQQLAQAREQENLVKENLSPESPFGKKKGQLGLNEHRARIAAAMQAGDQNKVNATLFDLRKFTNNQLRKAEVAKQAQAEAIRTGKQQLLIPKKTGKNTDWLFRENTEKYDNNYVRNKLKGFSIHRNSGKLIDQISKESEALSATYEALHSASQDSTLGTPVRKKKRTTRDLLNNTRKLGKQQRDKTATSFERTKAALDDDAYEYFKDAPSQLIDLYDILSSKTEGADINDVLDWVIANGTANASALVKKLKDLPSVQSLGKVNMHTAIGTKTDGTKYLSTGTYTAGKHILGINPLAISRPKTSQDNAGIKRLSEVIVHELIHAITFDNINSDADLNSDIKEVIEEIREWANANRGQIKLKNDLRFALSDPQEFLATIMGKPELFKDLAQIPSKKAGNIKSKFLLALRNFFAKFVRISDSEFNMMDRVLGLADVAIDRSSIPTLTKKVEPVTEEQTTPTSLVVNGIDLNSADAKEITKNLPGIGKVKAEAIVAYREKAGNISEVIELLNIKGIGKKSLDKLEVTVVDTPKANTAFADVDFDDINSAFESAINDEINSVIEEEQVAIQKDITEELELAELKLQDTDNKIIEGPLDLNELYTVNRLKAYFTFNGKAPLIKYKDFVDTVFSESNPQNLSALVPKGQKRIDAFVKNANAVGFINEFNSYRNKWNKDLDAVYDNSKNPKFDWTRPISFFTEEGKILPVYKDAITLAAFNFMLDNGNSLYYNYEEDSVRKILALDRTEEIDPDRRARVFDAGQRENTIIMQLGKAAYQALGLKANETSPENEEQLMQGALGSMALGVLYNEGFLEQHVIPAYELFDNAEEHEVHNFTRIAKHGEDLINPPNLDSLLDITKHHAGILSEVFGVDKVKSVPTLEPVKVEQETVLRGESIITEEQIELVNKMNTKEYRLDKGLMEPGKGMFHRMSKDLIKTIAGRVNTPIEQVHIDNRKGVQGKNASIDLSVEKLFEGHLEGILGNEVDTPFFIKHVIWKTFRIGQDSATVNPQLDKLHRAATVMKDWDFDIDINTGSNLQTFKLAVLESLGYKTDGTLVSIAINDFETEIAKVQKGVDVVRKLIEDETHTLTPAEEKVVTDAVATGGEDSYSFIGLRAIAQYQIAKEGNGKFTSNLHREGDGKTNGPMMALLQMGLTGNEKTDTILTEMGGFLNESSTYNDYADYANATGEDLYKYISKQAINSMQKEVISNPKKAKQYSLVSKVMGDLYKLDVNGDIHVTSDGRKATKNPVTVIIFGAGVKATMDSMGEGFVESFTKKIEEYQNDPERLAGMLHQANLMMPTNEKFKRGTNLLETPLTRKQKKILKAAFIDTYGSGVSAAIEGTFGHLLHTRKLINGATAMMGKMYKEVYDIKRAALVAKRDKGTKQKTPDSKEYAFDLTRGEAKALQEEMTKIFPYIDTYLASRTKSKSNSGLVPHKIVRGDSNNQAYKAESPVNIGDIKSLKYTGFEVQIAEPGVGIPILGLHSTDAFIAMQAAANMNMLNNHDAVTGSAVKIAEAMQLMNEAMFTAMAEYSMPQEVVKTLKIHLNTFQRLSKQHPELKTAEIIDMNLINTLSDKDKKGNNLPISLRELVLRLDSNIELANNNKISTMSRMSESDQYYIEGGKYTIPEETKSKLQSKVKKIVDDRELTSPPFTPTSGASTLTTYEVFDNLATDSEHDNHLRTILNDVVVNVHGPMGANIALIQAQSGETATELTARAILEGEYPFVSRAALHGINQSAAESFVTEQVELTMQYALNGSSLAYTDTLKIYKQARNTVKPSDFPGTPFEQQKIHDFIFKVNKDFNQKNSDHLSRFAALSVTYKPLMDALSFEVKGADKVKFNKAGEAMEGLFKVATNNLSNTINQTYDNQVANKRLTTLLRKLALNEKKKRIGLDRDNSKLLGQVEDIGKLGSDAIKKGIKLGVNEDLISKNRYRIIRSSGILIEAAVDDRLEDLVKGLTKFRNDTYRKEPYGIMASVFNEAIGATNESEVLHALFKETINIEQTRKLKIEMDSKVALGAFKNGDKFTDEDKKLITKTLLRTDLSSLLATYDITGITELLQNNQKRNTRILELEKQLTNYEAADSYLYGSKDLGYFLASSRNVSSNLFKNAHTLAHQSGTNNPVDPTIAEEVKPLVDELSTLWALHYTIGTDSVRLNEIINEEKTNGGVEFVIRLHKTLQDEALKDLFFDNPVQMQKGYLREIYDPNRTVTSAPVADRAYMESQGYEYISPINRDPNDPDKEVKALYLLEGIGLENYETGLFSNTGERAKGTTKHASISITNPQRLKAYKKNTIFSMRTNFQAELVNQKSYSRSYDPSGVSRTRMAPVLTPAGDVGNYQYLMGNFTKDSIMNRDNRFESVLASGAANQYDKVASAKQNDVVVDALFDFYREHYTNAPHDFVEVSLESKEPRLQDAYRLLPEATKWRVKAVWGEDRMLVRKDVLDMVTGYRNFTLMDAFGPNRKNFDETTIKGQAANAIQDFLIKMVIKMYGNKAAVKVKRAENMWQEVVKLIKDIVVIRNFRTLLGNVMSNNFLLFWQGVPFKSIVSKQREAIEGLFRYQEELNKIEEARFKLKGLVDSDPKTVKLKEQISELEVQLERNPVHQLVDAGMFSSIQEDVDTETGAEYFKNQFDELTDKYADKLPTPIRKAGEFVFVSRNTTLYRLLSKSTQMSDFVARYALFDHVTNRKEDPMETKEAIKTVREAFVNYNLPTHKALQYTNLMGVFMFTKYYLRTQKIILNLFREKPARAIAMILFRNYIADVSTIMDSNALGRIGNNPFEEGAFGIFDAIDEPIPLNMLLGLGK